MCLDLLRELPNHGTVNQEKIREDQVLILKITGYILTCICTNTYGVPFQFKFAAPQTYTGYLLKKAIHIKMGNTFWPNVIFGNKEIANDELIQDVFGKSIQAQVQLTQSYRQLTRMRASNDLSYLQQSIVANLQLQQSGASVQKEFRSCIFRSGSAERIISSASSDCNQRESISGDDSSEGDLNEMKSIHADLLKKAASEE